MDVDVETLSPRDLDWGSKVPFLNLSWKALSDVGLVGAGGPESEDPTVDRASEAEMVAMGLPCSFSTSKRPTRFQSRKKTKLEESSQQSTIGCATPDEWYEAYDWEKGAFYYYNCSLQVSQWDPPDCEFVSLTHQEIQQADSFGGEDTALVDSSSHEPLSNSEAAWARTNVSRTVFKYWLQRYSLFSRFDQGIKLDTAGWFSATPECVAIHQAARGACGILVDAFAGVGGNTIHFASVCDRVIAIDSSPSRIDIARHNAQVYGVHNKVDFICGDFFELAPALKADVVFISPPWGGPRYADMDSLPVDDTSDLGQTVTKSISYSKSIVKTGSTYKRNGIILFLPKNSSLTSVKHLGSDQTELEAEVASVNGNIKGLTVYLGNF